jgi:hypothetical protein
MTLELKMPRELEERLREEAKRRGVPTDAVAVSVLDENLPPAGDARRTSAIALLQSWMEEDAKLTDEELASNAAVLRNLDVDRPSYRKLFGEVFPGESQ